MLSTSAFKVALSTVNILNLKQIRATVQIILLIYATYTYCRALEMTVTVSCYYALKLSAFFFFFFFFVILGATFSKLLRKILERFLILGES